MKRRRPESVIQAAVFDHLRIRGVPGILAWHTPNGGYRSKIEARIFSGLGVMPGLPDVFILKNGCLHGLELKSPGGGRLTAAQIECHARLEAAGCKVAVAVGIDEALAQLETWNLVRGVAGIRSPALSTAVMTGLVQ